MSNAITRRLGRRLTAIGAGAALVAAGLSLGVMAPANADVPVIGGVTDAFGNPLAGSVIAHDVDSEFGMVYDGGRAGAGGTIESDPDNLLPPGNYKFEFVTNYGYREWFKDAADEASAPVVAVADGAPVDLGAWTIDQPYIVGTVTDPSGRPLVGHQVEALAEDPSFPGSFTSYSGETTETGAYKIAVPATPAKVYFQGTGRLGAEYYNDAADLATATPVTGTNVGFDLGVTILSPAGSISGQVTNDAGVPLESVLVTASSTNSSGVSADYTDKNGVYLIENVSTGANNVQFFDPIGEYTTEYFNNAATFDLATPVQVGVGANVPNVNAALALAPVDATKTAEITGTVKDSLGAPVVGARIDAWGTPAAKPDLKIFETVYSNRQGVYAFTELEKVQGENQFKLEVEPGAQGDDKAFGLFGSFQGGGQDYDRAPAVTVTPGTPVPVDLVMERAGGISGSVAGLAGVPFDPDVTLFGVPDGFAADGAQVKADGTFESLYVRPGTYSLLFDDLSGFHAPEWWKDQSNREDSVQITVKSGEMVGGLNAVLGNQLAAVERPETSSPYAWVGKALTAEPGAWTLQTGTAFKYEWLIGSTVVGTGSTFTPSASNIGDRLTVRVTGENGRLLGTATSKATSKIGYQPKVKVKAKGAKATLTVKAPPVKAKKVKGKVVVREIVKVQANGTIKYKKVGKGKIAKGKGTVSLAKLKKGKHKLVFFFTGSGKVGAAEVKKTVKR